MSNVLLTKLRRLESVARTSAKKVPRVVRLVTREQDEAEIYRMAEEMGLDTSPESDDILVIRLIGVSPKARPDAEA